MITADVDIRRVKSEVASHQRVSHSQYQGGEGVTVDHSRIGTLMLWERGIQERWVHPLILAAALSFDLLCIHPFRDGSGRVSRLLFLLATCKEFEGRVNGLGSPRGEKTAAVSSAVERQSPAFRMAEIKAACPGVRVDLIRRVLSDLQREKKMKALGTGRSAQWEKTNYI